LWFFEVKTKLLLSKLEDKVFLLCCGAETCFELFSGNSEKKQNITKNST